MISDDIKDVRRIVKSDLVTIFNFGSLTRILDALEKRTKALELIANHANRETNGLEQYAGDTYGFILKLAREGLKEHNQDEIEDLLGGKEGE